MPYDKLGTRQHRRRRSDIKQHMINFSSPLRDIGLEAVSVKLQTTNGGSVDIALKNTEEDPHKEIDNVHTFSYITTKYQISNESYHELSMQFTELPRSYKVISYVYSYIYVICSHITISI